MEANREYVISKQLLRSGTSFGANVEEAQDGSSKADFRYKMTISLREARETKYWLRLIKHGNVGNVNVDKELEMIQELLRILTAIVKSSTMVSDKVYELFMIALKYFLLHCIIVRYQLSIVH